MAGDDIGISEEVKLALATVPLESYFIKHVAFRESFRTKKIKIYMLHKQNSGEAVNNARTIFSFVHLSENKKTSVTLTAFLINFQPLSVNSHIR